MRHIALHIFKGDSLKCLLDLSDLVESLPIRKCMELPSFERCLDLAERLLYGIKLWRIRHIEDEVDAMLCHILHHPPSLVRRKVVHE